MALKRRRSGVSDIVIGLLATVGFTALLRFGAHQAGGGAALAPAPAPAPPPLAPAPPPGSEPEGDPREISALTLLREMADLEHLARLPTTAFTAGQSASTDRRSRRPDDPDGWFANDDFVTDTQPNLVRMETAADGGRRYVLLDVAGPGAIVRLWSANPAGTLRIYVDGQSRPAVEAPFAALLRGEIAPFVAPLAHVVARGYNLYFPIPYRRRCVVTVDSIVSSDPFTGKPTAKLYYQVGYRTYPAEAAARVRPFSEAEVARASGALGRVAAVLRDGLPPLGRRPGRTLVEIPSRTVGPNHPSVVDLPAPRGGGRDRRVTACDTRTRSGKAGRHDPDDCVRRA